MPITLSPEAVVGVGSGFPERGNNRRQTLSFFTYHFGAKFVKNSVFPTSRKYLKAGFLLSLTDTEL